MTLRAALAQLATVPPKAFTRERNALAVRLREAGYAKDAARVKARRAPTLPVWIANRLAIEHPDDVRALIAAADRVKAAQLGRGGKAGTLAAATAGHRAALDRLLDQGRAMLNQAGGGATHDKLLRVQNTLTAAAVDAAARKALQAGALERELTAPGFDVFGGDLPAGARGRAGAKPAAAEGKPAHEMWYGPRREPRSRRVGVMRHSCRARSVAASGTARTGGARSIGASESRPARSGPSASRRRAPAWATPCRSRRALRSAPNRPSRR